MQIILLDDPVCVATEFEGALLRERLSHATTSSVIVTGRRARQRRACRDARYHRKRARADRCLRRRRGVSGSGLQIGDVVCAATECYGDLGAQSPSGFLDMKALGFPVVAAPTPLFNELPMQIFPSSAA